MYFHAISVENTRIYSFNTYVRFVQIACFPPKKTSFNIYVKYMFVTKKTQSKLWRGGGAMNVFPSGYVLLDCNLTGLVSCSDIHVLGTLVRLRFVRLCVTTLNKSLNVT